LLSHKDGKHYTGLSSNVISRFKQHNLGKVRATKSRRPFELIYSEEIGNLFEAIKREKYLKTSTGRKFLQKFLMKQKVSGSLPA
jgi:putative endonuclease